MTFAIVNSRFRQAGQPGVTTQYQVAVFRPVSEKVTSQELANRLLLASNSETYFVSVKACESCGIHFAVPPNFDR